MKDIHWAIIVVLWRRETFWIGQFQIQFALNTGHHCITTSTIAGSSSSVVMHHTGIHNIFLRTVSWHDCARWTPCHEARSRGVCGGGGSAGCWTYGWSQEVGLWLTGTAWITKALWKAIIPSCSLCRIFRGASVHYWLRVNSLNHKLIKRW